MLFSLAPTSFKPKKKRKVVAHRERKHSPALAPDTPAVNLMGGSSVPPKDGSFPLPSQSSQPDASTPVVQERAESSHREGIPFVNLEEEIPSFEEKFKVKKEAFDEDGYIHEWAKNQFVGVPPPSSSRWPQGGAVIWNNYAFYPQLVMNDGIAHLGVHFL